MKVELAIEEKDITQKNKLVTMLLYGGIGLIFFLGIFTSLNFVQVFLDPIKHNQYLKPMSIIFFAVLVF